MANGRPRIPPPFAPQRFPGRRGAFFPPPPPIPAEERGDPLFCLFPDKSPGLSSKSASSPKRIFGLNGAEQLPMSRPSQAPGPFTQMVLRWMEMYVAWVEGILMGLEKRWNKYEAEVSQWWSLRGNSSSASEPSVTWKRLLSSSSFPQLSPSSNHTAIHATWIQMLTEALLLNRWSILIGLVVVVLASVAAWFFSPKGENNTIWRSSLILSFASCYIMWAIVFLAQWHPLIEPKRVNLRPGYA